MRRPSLFLARRQDDNWLKDGGLQADQDDTGIKGRQQVS